MPRVERKSSRRWLQSIIVLILMATLLPSAALLPATVQAEISADPNEEIVYIDNTGVIRVLDTLQTGGTPQVQWFSPTNGWEHFVLGDVNNDGDQEIIATKASGGQGTLTIWDPVVASGAFDDKINGIPWAKLYEISIPGNPRAVGTGRLDPNLPGDHIVYVFDVSSDLQRMVVLKPATPTPNGREWATHFTRDFNEDWEGISVGNVDNSGADEIMLIDSSNGRISIFKADSQSEAMITRRGESSPYRVGVIAQFTGGGGKEGIFIRSASLLTSFFVLEYDKDDNNFDEIVTDSFYPAPSFAFPADINDDGKEEIVMLRKVSAANAVRLIVRGDDPGDIPSELEQFLDSDNGYESGAGGDVDGDGKDEIVIMRNDKIRVYSQADRNASFDTYNVSTDKRNIHIGDLDKNGFVIGSQLGIFSGSNTVSSIEEELAIGATSSEKTLEVRDITNNAALPVTFEVENNPSWLKINTTTGTTPAPLRYQVNAIGLAAGDYTARIKVTSPNQTVVNQPLYVQVKLKVTAALIEPQATTMAFTYLASQQPVTLTKSVNIAGTAGVRFTAAVAPVPAVQSAMATLAGDIYTGSLNEQGQVVLRDDLGNEAILDLNSSDTANAVSWLTVSPTEGTIPGTVTLTLTSSNQSTDFAQAYLVIIGDPRTGQPPQNVRLITVTTLRANYQLFLPTAAKGQ